MDGSRPVASAIYLSGPRTADNRYIDRLKLTALAAESGAASVSYAISEWALVSGLASHLQLPWQLGSMLEWELPLESESPLQWEWA